MPRNRVRSVKVRVLHEDTDEEEITFLLAPEDATEDQCHEWITSDGESSLPVLALIFNEEDAAALAALWNAEVERSSRLENMAIGGRA